MMKQDRMVNSFEVFPWNINLETGITLIDAQHRRLVDILNQLVSHLADRSAPVMLNEVFNELVAYADYHFKAEEEIWQPCFAGDDWFVNHQHTHDSFIEKIGDLKKEGKPLDEIVGDVLGFLVHWLAFHILDTDKRMAKVVLGTKSGLSLTDAKQQANEEMGGAARILVDTVLTMYDSLSSRTLELLREKAARLRAEEELKASEERWKFLLDAEGDGVWDWNIQSGDVYRSAERFSLLGLLGGIEPQSEMGSNVVPEDLVRAKADLKAHLDGVTDMFVNEHRVVDGNGRVSWVLTRGKVTARDADGRPLRMIGTHSDITERELAAMIYRNTSEAIMVTDIDDHIIMVNPAFTRITGYETDEVVGATPRILKSERHDYEFYRHMNVSIQTTGKWQGEVWNRDKSGRDYAGWLTINTVYGDDSLAHRRVALFSDISERKQAEALIWTQANYDLLTNLPNRQLLNDRVEHETRKVDRDGSHFALLYIDLDGFKDINDTMGHHFGDELLIMVADRIQSCIRKSDTVARLGGDEFVVVLPEFGNPTDIGQVAQSILNQLSMPFFLGGKDARISASIGIVVYPDDATDTAGLLKNADQAMYEAKKAGRNCFRCFTRTMQEASQLKARLAWDIKQALEAGEFAAHYQPIVALDTGRICKAEVLLRWQHPEHGLISPSVFIPISEEAGAIHMLGDWVFVQAAMNAVRWQELAGRDFQISVNRSPLQFHDKGAESVDWGGYLHSLGLSGRSIVVEITESMLLRADNHVHDKLSELRGVGMQIALDDFGTGYSALSYLKKFDIDYIKIDQSFIRNLAPDNEDMVLCEAIVAMSHKLGIKVVAEGVETEQQLALLKIIGCDYGQGFLFSRAVPAEDFERLLLQDAGCPAS